MALFGHADNMVCRMMSVRLESPHCATMLLHHCCCEQLTGAVLPHLIKTATRSGAVQRLPQSCT